MKSQKQYEDENPRWIDDILTKKGAKRSEERKWKRVFYFIALCAIISLCALCFAVGSVFKTATIANLALSTSIALVIVAFFSIILILKVIPKVYPQIPLVDNIELEFYGCFDFQDKWVYKYIEVFKRFDDKKIIIDATSPSRKGAAILYITILIILPFFDLYPQVHDNLLDGDIWGATDAYSLYHSMLDEQGVSFTNKDWSMIDELSFGDNLGLAWLYVYFLLFALFSILSPRKIVVFDREKKTITIPPRWRIHKAETIPFYDAVITFGAKVDEKSFRGDEEVVIANCKYIVKGASLRFAGRVNGYCFARLIQSYMTEDDLSSHPEFETFKEIQEELKIKKVREEAKHQR